ncbi:MAG: redoxin domain-containing protein [Pirellulaceae bacterium]|nr:redoxin domain-containing protein [Pirellulaceae bacterium]
MKLRDGLMLAALLMLVGCAPERVPYETLVPFVEDAQTNAQVDDAAIGSLSFVDPAGQPVDLAQYRGKKNVVLVVTRGPLGTVPPAERGTMLYKDLCLYCTTQTSGLLNSYPQFQERDAEVIVVFPVLKSADGAELATFREAIPPLPTDQPTLALVLDVELKAVEKLGIRDNLSKPATYILNKAGQTRFAYVGRTIADRPSVQAILNQLDAINGAGK